MKKIQSKMKALDWPQDNMMTFWRSRADNSKQWWDLAEIRTHSSFMHVLVTCKNEEDPIKNESPGMAITFNGIFRFAQGQLTPQPLVRCHKLNCDVYLGAVLGSVLMCIFDVDKYI